MCELVFDFIIGVLRPLRVCARSFKKSNPIRVTALGIYFEYFLARLCGSRKYSNI